MQQTILGTYNMSFASDKGYDSATKKFTSISDDSVPPFPPSEALFLSQIPAEEPDKRIFWKNALNHLESFITEYSPLAVGLQEMNITAKGSKEGTDAIEQMLLSHTGYELHVSEPVKYNAAAALIIHLRTFKMGQNNLIL